jgi:hypothetical protein
VNSVMGWSKKYQCNVPKAVLTDAEKAINKVYAEKRAELIPEAERYANNLFGDRTAPMLESDDERRERDAKWNKAFGEMMEQLTAQRILCNG